MISDLPADLVEEILYRVPATSHKQLRSTCKLWNVLIKKNRRFTEKHFHEASKQSVVLMLDDHKVRSMNVNLNVSAPSIEFKSALSLKDSHSNIEQVNIARVFHCDGLLLCTTKENKVVVWNPYLGETKWIQLKTDYKRDFTYALGYVDNKSCRTYKILRVYIDGEDSFGLEIYEFSSDSWRVPLSNVDLWYTCFDPDTGVSLKGNTYWLTYHKEDLLLPFDFKTERFKCLPPPKSRDDMVVLSVVREEQLSLLYQNYTTSKMEIWITTNIDTEAEVLWSKSFIVDSEIQDPYTFQICSSSLIDEEKKVVVCCIVSSDHFNRINRMYTVNIIGEDDEYYTEFPNEEFLSAEDDKYLSRRWPIIFSYVPSLVQI
ncbi:F-box domain [Arabidopsis thaliana x Arabidopsis arenosa]|uniref:F-box domain n=1 Tax=Arabidopsis thaliana x Arabidopsis arenosa TaxID=1240361 RepID=A0A8T2AZR6_9BRAS|nr:F-box domain [Arabidopsis thaliana x Arabidopsis arenosa]